jgi:hypothetical protein
MSSGLKLDSEDRYFVERPRKPGKAFSRQLQIAWLALDLT